MKIKSLFLQHVDPELIQAFREQEMRVEHTINLIRFTGVMFLYLLNLIALVNIGSFTLKIGGIFLVMFAFFGTYSLFVHYFSRKGMHSPWLKYLTVTMDFTVLAGSFQKFKAPELMEFMVKAVGLSSSQTSFFADISGDIIASYLLIFVLYNFLSALRNGRLIILYSTLLAVAGSVAIMLQSNMDWFAQFYALFLVILSGVLTLTVSTSFNALFIRFQMAAQKVKEYSQTLEVKVEKRTEELNQKNHQLNEALIEVEQSNKKIMDSIQYAQRIQSSLLPSDEQMKRILPQNLLIWIPRDIVGGDIYYTEQFESGSIVAVIDCTGHGIPGAFMTMLALSGIKKITTDEACLDPAEILKRLNTNLKALLHQDSDQALSDDGLDASICFIDSQHQTLIYAGARQSLICMNNDQITRIKGDRHSVGYKKSESDYEYTNHSMKIESGISFYLYTDGLIDQLGGEKNFSFGTQRFSQLLSDSRSDVFEEQKTRILQTFNKFKNDNESQDDITVLGFSL